MFQPLIQIITNNNCTWCYLNGVEMMTASYLTANSFVVNLINNAKMFFSSIHTFHNVNRNAWFIDNSPLKRSQQWPKRIGHTCDWFVFCHSVLLGTSSSSFIYINSYIIENQNTNKEAFPFQIKDTSTQEVICLLHVMWPGSGAPLSNKKSHYNNCKMRIKFQNLFQTCILVVSALSVVLILFIKSW